MSLFTSGRERRLWLWTLTVLAAIYSTLGPARTIVDALRERNLLRLSFAVVVLIVVTGIVAQWAKGRPGWREIGVAFGIALAYWMTFLRMDNPAERTHLIEYGVVAALIHQALLERSRNGRSVPQPAALTVAMTAVLGLVDEGVQTLIPTRVFDWNDVFFNGLAGFMVVVARLALAPVQRPGARLWFLWLMAGSVGWGWSMDPGSFGEGRRIVLVPWLPDVDIPLYLSVAAGGTIVGVVHWLVLRPYLAHSIRWVPASIGAVAVGALLFVVISPIDSDLGLVAGVGSYGTAAGVVQWLVLRREVSSAGWWVLASTVGWLVAVPAGDAGGPPGWATFAAITGTVLVWLLRRHTPHTPGHDDRDWRAGETTEA